ncbi:hypothetical protein FRC01_000656 [Tulasnella sp. 417]|nr:hypothetical protein FRC01_000656 [Tulasnella sp. 417]
MICLQGAGAVNQVDRPTAVDCLAIVEAALSGVEADANSSMAELASGMSMLLSPPFSTTSRGSNISGESAPSPAHLSDSNQPQQEHPLSPATSPPPQNGHLWNELQKRYADHIQQPGPSVAKRFYRPQAPRLQHGLPPNQPLRENRPSTTATVAAQAEAESNVPIKQEFSVQEGSSILNSVPGPSASSSHAANVTDNTDLAGSSDAPLPQTGKGTPTPAWAVSPRVLLVDDDEVSRRLFSRFLQVLGCIVDVAIDSIGGVNKMNLETYDLVLMDIFMPKLDGMQATSIIRQSDHTTPIISMTTNPKPDDIANYSLAGMNDILPKPFTRESLSLVLEKHLERLKAIPTTISAAAEPSQAAAGDQHLS